MTYTGKDTSSGTEWREYDCPSCSKTHSERGGQALWSILHEDAEQEAAFKRLAPQLPANLRQAGCAKLLEHLAAGHAELIQSLLAIFERCEHPLDAEDAGIFLRKARGDLVINGMKRLLLNALQHRKLIPEIAAELADERLAEVFVEEIFRALGDPPKVKELCLELSRFPDEIQSRALQAKARAELLYSESLSRDGFDAVNFTVDRFVRLTPLQEDNLRLNARLRKSYRAALQELAQERGQKFAAALARLP